MIRQRFEVPLKDPTVEQRAKFALEFIGKNKTVLDVACAGGLISKIIKGAGNYVVGVDILPEYLKIAKGACNEVVLVDCAKKLPFRNGSFDAVFAGEFIEHINEEEGENFLKECKRVLKMNGLFILTTPNPDFIKMKIKRISREDMQKGGHIKIYKISELKKKLIECGFNIVTKRGLGKVGFLIGTRIPILRLYGDYGIVTRNE